MYFKLKYIKIVFKLKDIIVRNFKLKILKSMLLISKLRFKNYMSTGYMWITGVL